MIEIFCATKFFELADTIVKIGLGAFISGITAYWVATAKNKHELKKISLENKIKIMLEINEEIKDAQNHLSDFIHLTHKGFINSKIKNFRNIIDRLNVASNTASRAKSLANLIGFSQLASKISEYIDTIENLYSFIMRNDIKGVDINNVDYKKAEEIKITIHNKFNEIAPLISKAYQQLENKHQ